jgi:hypothetical protein
VGLGRSDDDTDDLKVSEADAPRRAGDAAAPFYDDRIRPPLSIAGIVAAIGGVVIAASVLFDMLSASIGLDDASRTTVSRSYFDTDNGKVVAALGVVVLVLSLATLVRPARSVIWPIAVTACGLAALGLAIYDRIDLDNVAGELRNRIYHDNPTSGVVHVTIGPALYIAMAGGVIATIGAVFASRDR